MAYSKRLEQEFKNIFTPEFRNENNKKVFDKKAKDVGVGLVGAPACGDVMQVMVKINDEGIIEDTTFKIFGCGAATASASLAAQIIKGMRAEDALKITNEDISKELNLPPVKRHCSLLAEEAIKAAIENYKIKQI